MEPHEEPLLSQPDLMLAVLKSAAAGPASIADCLGLIEQQMAAAGEPHPPSRALIADLLRDTVERLLAARLVERQADGRLALSRRGRTTMVAFPEGVDDSVLTRFPEFRAFMEAAVPRSADPAARPRSARRPEQGALQPAYDQGYAGYGTGAGFAENPYDTDTAKAAAWADGWSQARDDGVEVSR